MADIDDDRYQLLSERLDHYAERLDTIEDAEDQREERRTGRRSIWLEVAVLVFVGIETGLTALMYFHPHG